MEPKRMVFVFDEDHVRFARYLLDLRDKGELSPESPLADTPPDLSIT